MTHVALGINAAYHDSAAALIVDGRLVAAVEEERLNRIRHAKSARVEGASEMPVAAVEACLELAGVSMSEVSSVGFSLLPEQRYVSNVDGSVDTAPSGWGTEPGEREFRDRLLQAPTALSSHFGCDLAPRWTWLAHHACHAAGSHGQSGFTDSALLVVDGIGELASTSLSRAQGGTIECLSTIDYPHSLGMLWETVADGMGFTSYGAAQVMALAAAGDATRFRARLAELLWITEDGFAVDNELAQLRSESPSLLFEFLGVPTRAVGAKVEQEHRHVAASLQSATTAVVLHLARELRRRTQLDRLCYAGGVALNCVTNAALCEAGIFREVFIQPAANDAGTAIGAACLVARPGTGTAVADPRLAFFGPRPTEDECERALQAAGVSYRRSSDPALEAASLVAKGKIVGWFHGPMEFGPRALGARTIIADPRTRESKRRLDEEIKLREPFRPYAPSILAEAADEWFEIPESGRPAAPFMLLACKVKSGRRDLIPATVHIDGTARVQVVHQAVAPQYHRLIERFKELTGVPLVLNTSFNVRSPIVNRPEEAVDVFLHTSLDVLVLEGFIAEKRVTDSERREDLGGQAIGLS